LSIGISAVPVRQDVYPSGDPHEPQLERNDRRHLPSKLATNELRSFVHILSHQDLIWLYERNEKT